MYSWETMNLNEQPKRQDKTSLIHTKHRKALGCEELTSITRFVEHHASRIRVFSKCVFSYLTCTYTCTDLQNTSLANTYTSLAAGSSGYRRYKTHLCTGSEQSPWWEGSMQVWGSARRLLCARWEFEVLKTGGVFCRPPPLAQMSCKDLRVLK